METHSPVSLRSVSLLLLAMLALMIGSSLHKKLAYDEYPNLYYGYRFLTEGPSAIPDGQRMPILAIPALGCAAYQCDSSLLERRPAARLIVRLPSLLFALLLGCVIYAWARELYGNRAALFSLALYVFNPNFIAHGKQVTSDLATCLFFLLSIYLFWRYLQRQKRADLILSAFSTAAAIFSKYSGILIFAILFLLWSFRKIQDHRKGDKTGFAVFLKSSATGLGFCLIVLFLINSAYLFKGSFTKTNEIEWQSKGYQKLKKYSLPIPFPKTFILGMDYTKFIQENPAIGRGNNYILGKRHRRGRWYSFPLMVLLKTPLAFFLILLLAGFTKKSGERKPEDSAVYLFIPFLLWLIIFSTLCDLQLGVRYVLPAFVFLLIYAGKGMSGNSGPKTFLASGLLLGWYVVSSLSYYPHSLSYFNEAIGDRINAYRYLADSNLDWEDKSWWLDRFTEKHPELNAQIIESKDPSPKSGFLIVGANDYTGVLDEAKTGWMRQYKPIAHIAYSHYLLYVPPADK